MSVLHLYSPVLPQFSGCTQKIFNFIRTGVFGERVSLGSVSRVYSFVCKPRVLKFGTQLEIAKSPIESNSQLDRANCDISMTSYVNFVTDMPKIRPFTLLVQVLVLLS